MGCLQTKKNCLRATALLDNTRPRSHINKNGHKGIIAVDTASKIHGVTTVKAAFTTPQDPGVRQKGLRAELLEKCLIKMISEQIHAELNPEPPAPELCSVTKATYTAEGFKSVCPAPSMDCDYKTDQAITFWSENYHKVQGMTAVRTGDTPFKKNATFSTPISERFDDPEDLTLRN
ncbi:sperm associated antigen 8 isoform X2 [Hoplias malabaricus]|uniref:sperm associated antigen 8 isoform X2 n=1 Tax=Hoplias malabaricus TaxID=27720 RepID=UPI003462BC9A